MREDLGGEALQVRAHERVLGREQAMDGRLAQPGAPDEHVHADLMHTPGVDSADVAAGLTVDFSGRERQQRVDLVGVGASGDLGGREHRGEGGAPGPYTFSVYP
jgi:hypothetical protein